MDRTLILRDYPLLRSAGIKLSEVLVRSLQPEDLRQAARDLGILNGRYIDLETEDESSVLMDYAIHDIRHDGLNAIDRILRDSPPAEGSIELRLLRSMQRAFFTMFLVNKPEPGLGVHGDEGRERKPSFIVDFGFSKTAVPGLAIATRLHSPGDGWLMTTGAALPIPPAATDGVIRDLAAHARRHGVEPEGAALSALILRNCIAAGASKTIRYADVGPDDDVTTCPPVRRAPRIGRNDPCSCGSGKKYKKCCGR